MNNSPVIKIEHEDVEYDHGESSENFANPSTTTWIKVQDISLTLKDRWILQHDKKLTDKHINSAQRILKLKFPNINGLRLKVLQNKTHKQSTSKAQAMPFKFFMLMKIIGYMCYNNWYCSERGISI